MSDLSEDQREYRDHLLSRGYTLAAALEEIWEGELELAMLDEDAVFVAVMGCETLDEAETEYSSHED